MAPKFICAIIGHKWSQWKPWAFNASYDWHRCIRCGDMERVKRV